MNSEPVPPFSARLRGLRGANAVQSPGRTQRARRKEDGRPLNFHVTRLKDGVTRIVNRLQIKLILPPRVSAASAVQMRFNHRGERRERGGKKMGRLINFLVTRLKDRVTRIINRLQVN